MNSKSDAANDPLHELVMRGDNDALAEYFQQNERRLRRLIELRMDSRLQQRASASDVLQEAFVDLAQQYEAYLEDPQLPLYVWVRRVTGQRLSKFHRRHLGTAKRDAGREVALNHQPMPAATSAILAGQLAASITAAEQKLIREEQQHRMDEVLNDLHEEDREVIAMRNFEQLTNAEVAAALEISESAAGMRYMRAIRKLQKAMKRHMQLFETNSLEELLSQPSPTFGEN